MSSELARALNRRTTHAVLDETLVQALDARQHQGCHARNRFRGRRDCPADRDCPAGLTRPGVGHDSDRIHDSRHGVRVGAPRLKKARRIASDVMLGRESTAIRDLISSSDRSEHEKRAAKDAEGQAHNPE